MSAPDPIETAEGFAALIPVRTVASEDEDGVVVLLEPRFRGWPLLGRWLQPRLSPERSHVRVRLDARGGALWALCDGERDVAALTEAFRAAFPDDARDAESRVRLFLSGLQRHGFIQLLQRSSK